MRKIYSLVLMAAMLLVGTNARANVHDEQDPSDKASVTINGITRYATTIYDAFDAVGYDGTLATITLLTDIELEQSIVLYVPAEQASNPGKNIELNMNTFNISTKYNYINQTNTETTTKGAHTPFIILKGKLNITGEGNITNTCEDMGNNTDLSKGWPYWVSAGITLCGSASNDVFDFAKLTIGEKVTVTSRSSAGVALYAFTGLKQDLPSGNTTGYFGITESNVTTKLGYNNYDPDPRAGWGINIEISGHIYGEMYGMYVTGIISPCPTQDPKTQAAAYTADTTTKAYPRICINSSAIIESGCDKYNGKSKNGIYSSGWGIWKIRGTVKGTTGLYMKSGDINLNGANIQSCYGGTHEPPVSNIPGAGGTGAGSAIVINSANGGYAGGMSVTIEGDTKVSGANGSAIEEAVTTSDKKTAVNVITIESGTFENSGSEPAIVVDAHTTSDPDATITVGGGTWSDNSAIDEGLVGTGGFATTTTNEKGQQVIVISNTGEGGSAASSIDWHTNGDINTLTANDYLELTTVNNILTDNRAIKYLKMAAGTSVTIPSGYSLTVEEVVLNWTNNNTPADDSDDSFAKIIVEPGGKLIVTGDKGLYSPKEECLLIQATEENPGIFMFKPSVSSNKNPKGKVEFETKSYRVSSADRYNQRFGLPTIAAVSEIATNPVGVDAAFMTFNYSTRAWETAGFINHGSTPDMDPGLLNTPFEYYQLLCNVAKGSETTFTFAGSLVGNNNPSKTIDADTWYGIANSYTANMDLEAIVTNFSGNIAKTIWTYEANGSASWGWSVGNMATLALDGINKIKPMQAFLIRNANTTEAETMTLDYAKTVWNPVMGASNAPARRAVASSWTTAKLTVADEEGLTDCIYLVRDNQFSTDYDNGYDAEKYMNNNINLYISDEQAMSVLATNDLTDTYIGFACVTGGTYTISFNRINGETFDLIDLETNAIVHMSEGATYQFYANDNETNDYRFKVVTRQEMPTEVETVENVSNKHGGVYTLTGQYLGEMNVWNSLPAGLYIVNGEKKVK